MHVVILTYRVRLLIAVNLVAEGEFHLPVGKHLGQFLHAEEFLTFFLVGHAGGVDKNLHRQLVGCVHLLFEVESIYRKIHIYFLLAYQHPR